MSQIHDADSIDPIELSGYNVNDGIMKEPTTESNSNSSASSVAQYVPQVTEAPTTPELKRTPTLLQRVQSQVSFFNPRLKSHRFNLIKQFGTLYAVMLVCILGVFSIYWGASYGREGRLRNLRMLVVIEDEAVGGVEPVIGNTITSILHTPAVMARGDWRIQNITEFRAEAAKHNNTVQEEIFRQIHHQLYWSSIYVTKDATADYLKFIEGSNPSFNISTAIQSIYETGRDFVNMQSYVTPQIEYVEKQWLSRQNRLAGLFNSSESFTMEQVSRLSTPFRFEYLDHIPFTNPTLVAPSQVGLIYLIILTFFQVNMFSGIHQEMATIGMKNHHYLFYRLLSSSVSYFILSLGYSLVSLAFQVDFTVAFGKAGFLVYWMFSFITMMAVGFMNEVAFMILLMVFPPVAGFWLLFWVLINISSTFSPIALCPEFYRFGYAMPIHNSYELTKVVFFNTYKGQMGRNVGIIFAWIVIGMGSFSVVIPIFGKTMKKRAIAAKQKEAAAAAAKANENTKQEV